MVRNPNVTEKDIVERYRRGTPMSEIAADLHIGMRRVREALMNVGLIERSKEDIGEVTESEKREVIQLYNEGRAQNTIAKVLKISVRIVREILRREGVSYEPVKVRKEEVVKRKQKKSEIDDINAKARACGMSYGQYKGMLYMQKLKQD